MTLQAYPRLQAPRTVGLIIGRGINIDHLKNITMVDKMIAMDCNTTIITMAIAPVCEKI